MHDAATSRWPGSASWGCLPEPNSGRRRFARPHGVAPGAVLAGLALPAGAGEGVHRWAEFDLDQADAADDRLPPCARQGPGNSSGPQVDVLECPLRHRALHTDVGHPHASTRLEHPVNLPVHADLVGHRLMTPLEITTSAQPSSTGRCSMTPWRNSTLPRPSWSASRRLRSSISRVMSTPITRPAGPTHTAARKESMPAPEPRSTTRSPGWGWSQWKGLATPANTSQAASGRRSSAAGE
jgi:hypothetical protein